MSFADWNFIISDVSNTAWIPETLTEILGDQSAKFRKTTTGFNRRGSAVPDPTPLGHGYTGGRLRMLWKQETLTANHSVAITCMHSVEGDICTNAASANFYVLWIRPQNNDIELRKVTGGHFQTAGTLLASAATPVTVVADTVYATELFWFYDIAQYGGIRFGVKWGSATDYTDLALVTGLETYIDTTAPFSTSANEGIGWADRGTSGTNSATFDNVELYSLTLT